MSDVSQGPGWWQASDGKWYPPASAPAAYQPEPTYPPPAAAYSSAAPGYQPTAPPRTNGLAVTSLVLGILAFVTCAVTGIPGLITGVIARRQISESQGSEQGSGLAIGGIITSVIALALIGLWLLALLALTFLGHKTSFKFSAVGSAVS